MITETARLTARLFDAGENGPERKTAPAGNRGLTSAGSSRQEALMSILLPESAPSREAR